MSSNYYRFYEMLDKVDWLSGFWDKTRNELKIDQFEAALDYWSSSEKEIAKFFAAVWLGNNSKYGGDIVDIASRLDPGYRQIISDWILDPFYP